LISLKGKKSKKNEERHTHGGIFLEYEGNAVGIEYDLQHP
jgi:hypothetical protein